MVQLKEVFINFFKNKGIDIDNETIVIADSTGVDSSVLLDLALNYTKARIIVCHVNHKKRKASDDEEAYITKFCKDRNITIYVKRLEEEITSSFQEKARDFRYAFFKEVMRKENAKYLLLAHHLNDDIETMLLRMERGSSLKGYAGIEDCVLIPEGAILRPLLTVLKDDIYEYANCNGVRYFEDYTNKEDHYKRNVIRHNDIPAIFKEISNASADFIEMKKNINSAVCIINEYRDKLILNNFSHLENGYKFKVSEFNELNEFIKKEIIFEITKKHGLSSRMVEDILKKLSSSKANIIEEIRTIVFIKSYDYAYILDSYEKKDVFYVLDSIKEGILDLEGIKVKVSLINGDYNGNVCVSRQILAYNTDSLPLVIRSVKDGDEIKLDYGRKKISRLFIDKKVDLLKRNKTLVVLKDDVILMASGLEKSKEAVGKCKDIKNCNFMLEFMED